MYIKTTQYMYIITLYNQHQQKYWQKHIFENTISVQIGYDLVGTKGGPVNSYVCHLSSEAAIHNMDK